MEQRFCQRGLEKKKNSKKLFSFPQLPAEEALWTALLQHPTGSGSFRAMHGHTGSHDTAASDKNEVNKVN